MAILSEADSGKFHGADAVATLSGSLFALQYYSHRVLAIFLALSATEEISDFFVELHCQDGNNCGTRIAQ
jgi:hypothetical protein